MAILAYDGNVDYGYKNIYNIYVLKHPDSGEVFYVGQTKLNLMYRLLGHISESNNLRNNSEKCQYIRSLLSDKKRPIIESIEKIYTFSYLDRLEVSLIEYKWIKHYNNFCNLLNINGIKTEINVEYNNYLKCLKERSVPSRYYYCGSDNYGNKYYDLQRIQSDGFYFDCLVEQKPQDDGLNFEEKKEPKVDTRNDMFYNDIPLGW